MSINNQSPEQWHRRVENIARASKEVTKAAKAMQKTLSKEEKIEEKALEVLSNISGRLPGKVKFLQKMEKDLSKKKKIEGKEEERIIDLMKSTEKDISDIQKSMSALLQQREIETQRQLQEELITNKQEVEQWHLHIQHLCEVSQALVRTMGDLQQELQEQGGTAEQERLSALVEHHISDLQLADQKISAEEKISKQNRKEILNLLARCQKSLDEIGQLINPILYQKYLGEREEPEEGRAAQWQAPEGVDADHAAREKYQVLLQQAEEKISRGEQLDDELFAQLVAHRKQITGLLSAEQAPAPEKLQWYIHYGLLKQAYQKAVEENDLALRQKIGFLLLFYLNKVTSLNDSSLRLMTNKSIGIDSTSYHRGQLSGTFYNMAREALLEKMILTSFFKEKREARSVLYLLDHKEVGDLLKEIHHVVNTEGNIDQIAPGSAEEEALVTEWTTEIKKCINEALEKGTPLNEIRKRFLFDFTKDLEGQIEFLGGDKAAQKALLKEKIVRIKTLLNRAIKEAAISLKNAYPEQLKYRSELVLRYFIQCNGIAICRGTIDNINYVTELPLLQTDQEPHFLSRDAIDTLETRFTPFNDVIFFQSNYLTRSAEIDLAKIVEEEKAKYLLLPPQNIDEEINPDERVSLIAKHIAAQIFDYYNEVLDENYATTQIPLFLDFTSHIAYPLLPAGFAAFYSKAVSAGILQAAIRVRKEKNLKEINIIEFATLISQNLCCFCRTPNEQGEPVITVLRLASTSPEGELPDAENLYSFISGRGLKIGAVRLPYNLFDNKELVLEEVLKRADMAPEIEYAPQGEETTIYYPNIEALLKIRLFNQLLRKASLEQERYPQITVLTKATVDLFTGMLQEISFQLEREEEGGPLHTLYNSPVIQTTLHRFLQHLAAAENVAHDTGAFINALELAHAELTTLITLFQPYSREDFSQIFKERLQHIPRELQELTQAGVGTASTFIFSCINEAVAKTTPEKRPQKAYSEGLYYEEAGVMGDNIHIDELLKDENVTQIDFYAAQFNHNINPSKEHTHYAPTQVIENIEAILEKKKDTKRLTVAVDCTIDFIESPQVKQLLEHFSEQIRDGTLNFVFFGSGQKFALLGQDNYYGAPFYVVNNGNEHWAPFKALTSEERFQTDPLSQQWFCLSNRYAFDSLEAYRRTIFANHREALNRLAKYAPQQEEEQAITVCTVEQEMRPCFIDLRLSKNQHIFQQEIEKVFKENNQPLGYRSSFGFMHTNINRIGSSFRITLGLDPKDVDLVVKAIENFEEILLEREP